MKEIIIAGRDDDEREMTGISYRHGKFYVSFYDKNEDGGWDLVDERVTEEDPMEFLFRMGGLEW